MAERLKIAQANDLAFSQGRTEDDHAHGQYFLCDRCGTREIGLPEDLIADCYHIDDPTQHAGALCPTCAAADDPYHLPGSWLLSWFACHPPQTSGRGAQRLH